MRKRSAGIIPYKVNDGNVEFFLGHPGGMDRPYYAYLKGEVVDGEDDIDAAVREFGEESGVDVSGLKDRLEYLGEVRQNKNKNVVAFALKVNDINPDLCFSNMCDDGATPEIDRYGWFTMDQVLELSHRTHIPFYNKIMEKCR